MGQITQLQGKRIYLDTNIFIYALEKVEPFFPVCKSIFALIQSGQASAVTLEESTFLMAAQLRAKHSIKMPDALHLAVAIQQGCDCFITNDKGIPSLPDAGIERLLLKDFITG